MTDRYLLEAECSGVASLARCTQGAEGGSPKSSPRGGPVDDSHFDRCLARMCVRPGVAESHSHGRGSLLCRRKRAVHEYRNHQDLPRGDNGQRRIITTDSVHPARCGVDDGRKCDSELVPIPGGLPIVST